MAQKGLEDFYEAVLANPDWQEKLKAAPDKSTFVNTAVTLGTGNGYSFSATEVESVLNRSGSGSDGQPELSPEQLKAVSGASARDDTWNSCCGIGSCCSTS